MKSPEAEYQEHPRSPNQLAASVKKLCDQVWHERHLVLAEQLELGKTTVDPVIWKRACKAAREMEAQYPGELGPYSEFEWGMINGKLSALRWALGEPWDMLDT